MTTTEINIIVESIAKDCGYLHKQVDMLKRFSLHKLTKLSLDKIADETGTSTKSVYASIQRVETEHRFQEFRLKLFAMTK